MLFSSLLKILPAQRSEPATRASVWSGGIAWTSRAPPWSLLCRTGRSCCCSKGSSLAQWMDTGWTLEQLGPGITRGKQKVWQGVGEKGERGRSSTQDIRVPWSILPLLSLCWAQKTARWDSWEEAGRGFHKFPKALGSVTQAQEFKVSLTDLEA